MALQFDRQCHAQWTVGYLQQLFPTAQVMVSKVIQQSAAVMPMGGNNSTSLVILQGMETQQHLPCSEGWSCWDNLKNLE